MDESLLSHQAQLGCRPKARSAGPEADSLLLLLPLARPASGHGDRASHLGRPLSEYDFDSVVPLLQALVQEVDS